MQTSYYIFSDRLWFFLEAIFKVKDIIREMGNGATKPMLAIIRKDNGEEFYAVIKTKSNPEGVLALINEVVCYYMADALEILMPQSGVALITKETVCYDDELMPNSLGSCFYSELIPDAMPLNIGVIDLIENEKICIETILFDHIIYNKDRNMGNLLISNKDRLLYVIDHSHVFKNQTIWDRYCFKQGIDGNDFRDIDILDSNKYMYDMLIQKKGDFGEILQSSVNKFKATLNRKLLDEIGLKIPNDWLLNNMEEEIKYLIEYIVYRVDHINEISEMILQKYRRA